MNKKKFSAANLLYIFSMFLGLVIIVMGFTVANNARKQFEQNETQNIQKQEKIQSESATVSKPAEKIIKNEEPIVIEVEQTDAEENFEPMLENQTILPPADGEISLPFTGSSLVYSEVYDEWSVHKGVHIASEESAQVKAVANGKVTSVYKDNREGITIILQHGDFTTIYKNLSTDKLVKVGDKVRAGDIISGVGKSSEGESFLHFEINYKGKDIDPEPLIVR